MSKSVKIVFTVSILLNVLFLGIAVGGFVHGMQVQQRPWDRTKARLTHESRDIIKSVFKHKRKAVMPLFKEVVKQREEVRNILSAPEFDVNAYDAFVAEFKTLNWKLMDSRLNAVRDIFSKLPVEERRKIAGYMAGKILGKVPDNVKRCSGVNRSGCHNLRAMRKGSVRDPRRCQFPFVGCEGREKPQNYRQ